MGKVLKFPKGRRRTPSPAPTELYVFIPSVILLGVFFILLGILVFI